MGRVTASGRIAVVFPPRWSAFPAAHQLCAKSCLQATISRTFSHPPTLRVFCLGVPPRRPPKGAAPPSASSGQAEGGHFGTSKAHSRGEKQIRVLFPPAHPQGVLLGGSPQTPAKGGGAIGDVYQGPAHHVLRCVALVHDLDVLIGLGPRDPAVEEDARYLDVGPAGGGSCRRGRRHRGRSRRVDGWGCNSGAGRWAGYASSCGRGFG